MHTQLQRQNQTHTRTCSDPKQSTAAAALVAELAAALLMLTGEKQEQPVKEN